MADLDLLARVRTAARALEQAKSEYFTSVVLAKSRGHSNIAIARAAGKTEAAIRIYLKRKLTE